MSVRKKEKIVDIFYKNSLYLKCIPRDVFRTVSNKLQLTFYNNYIMASCCLAKIQSRVKGHHVYNYAFKVSEILNCSIEYNNEYSENTITVFSSSKKKWLVIF